jgi:hypothetical protein
MAAHMAASMHAPLRYAGISVPHMLARWCHSMLLKSRCCDCVARPAAPSGTRYIWLQAPQVAAFPSAPVRRGVDGIDAMA